MDTIVTSTPAQPQTLVTIRSGGPIARIVVGSVLTGLLGAALLTLVVFAGAKEHVITGSAMLAFGCGWAMLAVLSTRLTDQPQRWRSFPRPTWALSGSDCLPSPPATRHSTRWVGSGHRLSLPSPSG
jgi:hypothetical protein